MGQRASALRRRLAFAARLAVVAVTALPTASETAAATQPATEPPGWFLQVSSLAPAHSPGDVVEWVRAACAAARTRRPVLVLQDITDDDQALATAYLDAIAPYLPGGQRACVGHLYVGTLEPQPTGAASPYAGAVGDAAFRADYVSASRAAAQRFVQRYPQLRFDWYVAYEANLNGLYFSTVRSSYQDLFRRLKVALDSVRGGRSYLWSPAFWYPYSEYRTNVAGMAELGRQLGLLFAGMSADGQRTTIDLQDFVAGSSCQPPANRTTPTDAAAWVRYLSSIPGAPPVALNVEQYQIDCATGRMSPAEPAELAARMAVYAETDTPLGPAFELRYRAGMATTSSR